MNFMREKKKQMKCIDDIENFSDDNMCSNVFSIESQSAMHGFPLTQKRRRKQRK